MKKKEKNTKELAKGMTAMIKSINIGGTITIDALKSSKQDVQEWFETYERLTESQNWSEEKKGRRLPGYLRDHAVRYWEGMDKEDQFVYKKVKKFLLKKYKYHIPLHTHQLKT